MVHPFSLIQNEFQTGVFNGSAKAISNDGMGSAARHITIFLVHKYMSTPFLITYRISTYIFSIIYSTKATALAVLADNKNTETVINIGDKKMCTQLLLETQ
jgi:hypothetical protein